MKKFLIHVIDRTIFESYGLPCCTGEIQIGNFKETFEMPLDFWTIEDYEKQWDEGIERLKTYDRSCLVAEVQDPIKRPRASLWVLYREEDEVYIQNNLLFGKRFAKMLAKKTFNIQTCYDFTIPRSVSKDEEYPVSEWHISYKDIFM